MIFHSLWKVLGFGSTIKVSQHYYKAAIARWICPWSKDFGVEQIAACATSVVSGSRTTIVGQEGYSTTPGTESPIAISLFVVVLF